MRRRRRLSALCALLAMVGALLGSGSVNPGPAGAAIPSGAIVQVPIGDPLAGASQRLYIQTPSVIASGGPSGPVTVTITGDGLTFNVVFENDGDPLGVGTVNGTTHDGAGTTAQMNLTRTDLPGACTATFGRYTIKDIGFTGGAISRLSMDLDQRCNFNTITQPVATVSLWFQMDPGALGTPDATEFLPVASPVRVLDTREGIGLGRFSPLGPNERVDVAVTGCGGCPPTGTTKAVVMNVTATGGTTPGFLRVWPKGGTEPEVSNVNWKPFESRPNLAVVKVSNDGMVSLFNPAGETHAIFDVIGYFVDANSVTGGRFHALTPTRLLDTRDANDPLQPLVPRNLPIPVGATGAVLNVTASGLDHGGYITVYPSDVGPPLASNLNFQPGEIVPNLVVAGVANGSVNLISDGLGPVHVIVDLVGWFDTNAATGAGRFVPIDPSRKFDSRLGIGALNQNGEQDFGVAGQLDRHPFEVSGVVMNTTVANTTAQSYLTVYPTTADSSRPWASNLNWLPGEDRPNLVMVGTSDFGFVTAYNALGSADLIYDVAGWFTG
jgi:hypothetical protein